LALRLLPFAMMDCPITSGNDVCGNGEHARVPSPPDRLLTEETVETLYPLGEQDRLAKDRIVARTRYARLLPN
jgi:hypothetical protein